MYLRMMIDWLYAVVNYNGSEEYHRYYSVWMEKVIEKTIKHKDLFMEQSISHQLAAKGDDIKTR